MVNIFEFSDYKKYLKALISENRLIGAYQTQLATAMGCQKSYLSQVLRGTAHLSTDHAANLCEFLTFSEAETSCFVDLVLHARAGSRGFRAFLSGRLERVRKESEGQPPRRFKWPELGLGTGAEVYYSAWYWAAIHMIVSIDRYDHAGEIAKRLALPLATVESVLQWLVERKLIEPVSVGGWKASSGLTYLPDTSPLSEANHLSWRQRAAAHIQSQERGGLHYSSVFTLSKDDARELKEQMLKAIERMNSRISASPSEELMCFMCDMFRV